MHSALFLFATQGYKAVKIDDVANRSKCSRALIYHYFTNKECLFRQMMRDIVVKNITMLTEHVDFGGKAINSIRQLLNLLLDCLKQKNEKMACVLHLILNLHLQKNVVPKPIDNSENRPIARRTLYQIMYYLIEKGEKEKDIPNEDPRELSIAILSLLSGLSLNKIYLKNKFVCPSTDILINMLLRKENC